MITSITLKVEGILTTAALFTADSQYFSGKVVRAYVVGTSDEVDLDIDVLAGNGLPAKSIYSANNVDSTAGVEVDVSALSPAYFAMQKIRLTGAGSNENADSATATIIIDTDG